jgi:hypothetical protein
MRKGRKMTEKIKVKQLVFNEDGEGCWKTKGIFPKDLKNTFPNANLFYEIDKDTSDVEDEYWDEQNSENKKYTVYFEDSNFHKKIGETSTFNQAKQLAQKHYEQLILSGIEDVVDEKQDTSFPVLKVGDKVKVREDLVEDEMYGNDRFTFSMTPHIGKIVTIHQVIDFSDGVKYKIEEDVERDWYYTPVMFDFTLETLPYKVGDKVKVKNCSTLKQHDTLADDMVKFCGKIVTISNLEKKFPFSEQRYQIKEDPYGWYFHHTMFEPISSVDKTKWENLEPGDRIVVLDGKYEANVFQIISKNTTLEDKIILIGKCVEDNKPYTFCREFFGYRPEDNVTLTWEYVKHFTEMEEKDG